LEIFLATGHSLEEEIEWSTKSSLNSSREKKRILKESVILRLGKYVVRIKK